MTSKHIDQESNYTRRSFILGAGIGAAGLLGGGVLSACSSESPMGEGSASAQEVSWDKETDIVVAGSGTSGISAALTALDAGAEVIMLEKTTLVGGVSSACVQFCAYDSNLHLPQPYPDVTDNADIMFENSMKISEQSADPELLKIFCDGSPDGINWMLDHGCEFKDALKPAEGRPGQGKYITAAAGEFTTKLLPFVEEKGQILSECTLSKIIRDGENGRVVGIAYVDAEGNEQTVKARKAVILCTGMWTNDEQMLSIHAPLIPQISKEASGILAGMGMPSGPFTGEAIRAAQKVGANVRHMDHLMPEPYWSVPELMEQGVAVAGITRSVNQVCVSSEGKRFADEGASRGVVAKAALELPDALYYPILDGHIVPKQMNPKPEVLDKWVEDGYVLKADTIEALAAQMEQTFGVPQEAVIESISRYNGFCAAGFDEDFEKDPHYLLPLDQPPYYAGPQETSLMFYTHGGLDADARARVKDVDGEVIPGLYAAGMCAGGHFGKDTVSGNWQMNALVFGRIAGSNAAAETA